jgi:tRNA(Arg) A34 adenosine deaminase TadA
MFVDLSAPDYYDGFMNLAIREAELSLQEGNKGFGAVIVRNGTVFAGAHDSEVTESNPTAHAEMKLVREACMKLGRGDLSDCIIVSTHEPCPMCTGAIVWAKVSEIIYGTSITKSKSQGRTMIDMSSEEIVKRSPWQPRIRGGILEERCSTLYDDATRKLVKQFRTGGSDAWRKAGESLLQKRIVWFENNAESILGQLHGTEVEKAYQLILMKLGISEEEAPIVEKSRGRVVFHSINHCPALQACVILDLDTKDVCALHTEKSTEELIKRINPNLRFTRNYEKVRPHTAYCEEIITLES